MPTRDGFDVELQVHETSRGHLVETMPQLIARVAGIKEAGVKWGRDTAVRAARIGSEVMERAAPEAQEDHSDFPLTSPAAQSLIGLAEIPSLKERINYDKSATLHAGGAGGGSYYAASFGVRRIPGLRADRDPASFVFHGTGRRGDHLASGSNITPEASMVMTWMAGGEQHFAKSTGGQRSQKDWFYAGRTAARAEIRRRIVEFDPDRR
jgi:hypothetical protein